MFEETIAAFTLLAVYMPVVAGMGGNAGTQSMAVTVRGIALGQISLSTGGRAVVNKIIAGGANGVITGVLVAVIASVFNRSPLLGLVLGVSMVLNLFIAGFFGTTIPLVLDRKGSSNIGDDLHHDGDGCLRVLYISWTGTDRFLRCLHPPLSADCDVDVSPSRRARSEANRLEARNDQKTDR